MKYRVECTWSDEYGGYDAWSFVLECPKDELKAKVTESVIAHSPDVGPFCDGVSIEIYEMEEGGADKYILRGDYRYGAVEYHVPKEK